MQYCRPPDPTPRLAVLGSLGIEEHSATRSAIRRTWMSRGSMSGDVLPFFVLRGVGARESTISEAAARGDIIFLETNASQPRTSGPLSSLLLWLECAIVAWPAASLIGKTEEDVWLHLPGIAHRLRLDMRAIQSRQQKGLEKGSSSASLRIYWGLMETCAIGDAGVETVVAIYIILPMPSPR